MGCLYASDFLAYLLNHLYVVKYVYIHQALPIFVQTYSPPTCFVEINLVSLYGAKIHTSAAN
jgi:hypothetical protein